MAFSFADTSARFVVWVRTTANSVTGGTRFFLPYLVSAFAGLTMAAAVALEVDMLKVLGAFLIPLLLALAARLFMRLGSARSALGFGIAAFLFFPLEALAQTAPAAAPAPNMFVALLQQYAPTVVGLLIALFLAHSSGIVGWLQAKRDAADSSAGIKALSSAGLMVEHLAEVFAAKIQADLKANPTATASQLVSIAGNEAKATLSSEAVSTIEDGLGVIGSELGPYLGKVIAAKLGGAQLTQATQAANAASAKVQAMPLAGLAGALAAGPKGA